MNKPRLCLDIDNVLCDTDAVIRHLIVTHSRSHIELSYDEIVAFNYYDCVDSRNRSISREEWQVIHEIFSLSENILSIKPYPGIQGYIRRLADKYCVHLATARLASARYATVKWLEQNDFPAHNLHFIGYGEKHLALGVFCATVEDDPFQAERYGTTGAISFLLAHPWNKHFDATLVTRVDKWDMLVDKLLR